MVNAIIRWCLNNPFLMGLAVIGLLVAGAFAIRNTQVDAIPDIGDKQVIVCDWPGRSPQDVTTRSRSSLSTSLTGTPGVKTIRSMSGRLLDGLRDLQDDVDYYWARSRVLERLNVAQGRLPTGVVPMLGPMRQHSGKSAVRSAARV